MKYFALIWSGLWRKRTRTIFTLFSIVVEVLLFGTLQGVDSSFKQLVDSGRLNVLVATNPSGLPLPLGYQRKIESVPGVTAVAYEAQILGYYQSRRNILFGVAVDPATFFNFDPQAFSLPADQLRTFNQIRTGIVITPMLAERLKWKVGDHVPFHSMQGAKKDGSADWTFDVVGVFDTPGGLGREEPLFLMSYQYFDEARATRNGTVQMYAVKITDAAKASEISMAIDNLFGNSSTPTRTGTERANAQAQLAQIGNLDFFVDAIVGAAFFTLLLVTASTMLQSYRERIRDFAVMKTLGFTDTGVAALVLSEALLLSTTAAAIGLICARALLQVVGRAGADVGFGGIHLPWSVLVAGLVAATSLALVSTLPAAWRAKRLSIVEALAVAGRQ
jgi:putative ABC transport system permease protein